LTYPERSSGGLDLRLRRPKTCELRFELGTHLPPEDHVSFEPLPMNPVPEVDFTGWQAPFHLTRELLSHVPRARTPTSIMLDLGCGEAIHRDVMEHCGYEYVGLDYDTPGAPFLGDAHALPFREASFEFILSIAVLEHIRYPHVMMTEAARVLKPGGRFMGTVAFLEPFHLNSYYHHSHLGTLNSLQYAGFDVLRIAPSTDWTGLRAQALMEFYPRMPRTMIKAIVAPVDVSRRLWQGLRRLRNPRIELNQHARNVTGSFTFIATKSSA
jgi:SAM-dependent methyltransferase